MLNVGSLREEQNKLHILARRNLPAGSRSQTHGTKKTSVKYVVMTIWHTCNKKGVKPKIEKWKFAVQDIQIIDVPVCRYKID